MTLFYAEIMVFLHGKRLKRQKGKEVLSMESIGNWWNERSPIAKGLLLGGAVAAGVVVVMGLGALAAARVMKNDPGMDEPPSQSEGEVLEIPETSEEA